MICSGQMKNGMWSIPRLKRLDSIMSGYVERGEIPGIVSLVSRGGEVHSHAVGNLAIDRAEPMECDSLFRIASLTKPITAVAAMILVEECKIRLDEPVDRFLPELANRKVLKRIDGALDDVVPATRPISVRDLLTLRLGIGYLMIPFAGYPIQIALRDAQLLQGPPQPQLWPAPDEWIARVGALPLMYQPGERWMYDLGMDIVGVLIARAAKQPLADFLQERLFEPLGMKDTRFHVPAEKIRRFADCYFAQAEAGPLHIYDAAVQGQWSVPPAFPAGASGLVSTADDYLAFGEMLLNKGVHGRERVLSRASVEVMTTDQLTPEQKAVSGLLPDSFESHGWGFGLGIITKRRNMAESVGMFGWDGGLGTSFYADPQEKLVGVLMTQRAWTSSKPPDVRQDFWTCVYQAFDD